MKTKKALLEVEPQSQAVQCAFSAIVRPSRKYAGTTIISFPDFETLGRVITGARVELLNAIRTRRPKSIQELARIVHRDFENVYQDVKILAEFGLIEIHDSGPRRAAAILANFSELILAA